MAGRTGFPQNHARISANSEVDGELLNTPEWGGGVTHRGSMGGAPRGTLRHGGVTVECTTLRAEGMSPPLVTRRARTPGPPPNLLPPCAGQPQGGPREYFTSTRRCRQNIQMPAQNQGDWAREAEGRSPSTLTTGLRQPSDEILGTAIFFIHERACVSRIHARGTMCVHLIVPGRPAEPRAEPLPLPAVHAALGRGPLLRSLAPPPPRCRSLWGRGHPAHQLATGQPSSRQPVFPVPGPPSPFRPFLNNGI